jgi:hypothetical protein
MDVEDEPQSANKKSRATRSGDDVLGDTAPDFVAGYLCNGEKRTSSDAAAFRASWLAQSVEVRTAIVKTYAGHSTHVRMPKQETVIAINAGLALETDEYTPYAFQWTAAITARRDALHARGVMSLEYGAAIAAINVLKEMAVSGAKTVRRDAAKRKVKVNKEIKRAAELAEKEGENKAPPPNYNAFANGASEALNLSSKAAQALAQSGQKLREARYAKDSGVKALQLHIGMTNSDCEVKPGTGTARSMGAKPIGCYDAVLRTDFSGDWKPEDYLLVGATVGEACKQMYQNAVAEEKRRATDAAAAAATAAVVAAAAAAAAAAGAAGAAAAGAGAGGAGAGPPGAGSKFAPPTKLSLQVTDVVLVAADHYDSHEGFFHHTHKLAADQKRANDQALKDKGLANERAITDGITALMSQSSSPPETTILSPPQR